jgi:LuxR family maltose regulon positive regulatory protein
MLASGVTVLSLVTMNPTEVRNRAQVLGQIALLEGRLEEAEAESALLQALELYRHWRFCAFLGHPGISLALLRLAQGNTAAAWAEFEPVLQQALTEDSIGFLLMEPREPLERLLKLIPAGEREGYRALLERLAAWRSPTQAPPAAVETGTDSRLSEREIEVLQRIAAGDSNKQIARTLDLSPHTVKRHVVNILQARSLLTRSGSGLVARSPGISSPFPPP